MLLRPPARPKCAVSLLTQPPSAPEEPAPPLPSPSTEKDSSALKKKASKGKAAAGSQQVDSKPPSWPGPACSGLAWQLLVVGQTWTSEPLGSVVTNTLRCMLTGGVRGHWSPASVHCMITSGLTCVQPCSVFLPQTSLQAVSGAVKHSSWLFGRG